MGNSTYLFLSILTSKWLWMAVFIVLLLIGTFMTLLDKKKETKDTEKNILP